jgi:hypothetical protein
MSFNFRYNSSKIYTGPFWDIDAEQQIEDWKRSMIILFNHIRNNSAIANRLLVHIKDKYSACIFRLLIACIRKMEDEYNNNEAQRSRVNELIAIYLESCPYVYMDGQVTLINEWILSFFMYCQNGQYYDCITFDLFYYLCEYFREYMLDDVIDMVGGRIHELWKAHEDVYINDSLYSLPLYSIIGDIRLNSIVDVWKTVEPEIELDYELVKILREIRDIITFRPEKEFYAFRNLRFPVQAGAGLTQMNYRIDQIDDPSRMDHLSSCIGLNGRECSICTEDMTINDRLVQSVECQHCFHEKCLNTWRKITSNRDLTDMEIFLRSRGGGVPAERKTCPCKRDLTTLRYFTGNQTKWIEHIDNQGEDDDEIGENE